jgi:hypothetical protein
LEDEKKSLGFLKQGFIKKKKSKKILEDKKKKEFQKRKKNKEVWVILFNTG